MKCPCGYEGIPTSHADEKTGRHSHWKCPTCHGPKEHPLKHDPMKDDHVGDFICSQCGMRGAKPEDLHTECPGHGAHWYMQIWNCTCGEWAVAPQPVRTIICKRCNTEYPEQFKVGYVAPVSPRGKISKEALIEALHSLLGTQNPVTVENLLNAVNVEEGK